jgi:hypothetical protein
VLFALDYLALRSKEYEYLLRFVSHYNPSLFDDDPTAATLSSSSSSSSPSSYFKSAASHLPTVPIHCHFPPACLMPGMLFSAALAKFRVEGEKNSEAVEVGAVSCHLYQQQLLLRSASSLLQAAILLFPEMLAVLLPVASDRELNKAPWPEGLLPPLAAMHTPHPYVEKLVAIYAVRCGSLWADEVLLTWVRLNAIEAVAKWKENRGVDKLDVQHLRSSFYSPTRAVPTHVRMLMKSHYRSGLCSHTSARN